MTLISLPTLAPETIVRTRLANGLTVLVRRDDSAPVVAIVTHVKAGYFDETDDIVGIAHVLEHMYFKGTPTRGVGEISKATKSAGGYLNAGTIYDYTSYYTVLPSSGFIAGLEIQADAYASSAIDGDELRKELEVIIQEAKRKADNPGAVTIESLYELLHDTHRMRRWRIGREEGLRALTRSHVAGFYRNFYRPHNTILVIVGDVAPDEALQHVERLYGSLEPGEIARDEGPGSASDKDSATASCRVTSPRRTSRSGGAPRRRFTPTRRCSTRPRRWSVRDARHDSIARCESGSSRHRFRPTTTRRRSWACSSFRPKARRTPPSTRRGRRGDSCATSANRALDVMSCGGRDASPSRNGSGVSRRWKDRRITWRSGRR
jgi:hypothetical protein